ncbi:hypothetical protein DQM68_15165 [Leptospira mayottensis]|uniref:Uncharacterized protein n=1 Tax=Leptospira mayottensis TaxID=1137606 RepID=A0ABN5NZI4_9LEPT|nr:hypothetical protein DQM68_15165 [Leptospira mayottensis]AXR66152.1 hypothetical protein DQM28_12350 [Leptospira mayottensis]AXR69398.1 hypothetical protein DPV73_16580 [Leptospira mayottensis]AZQ03735.1 hypothetical protein LEP1GSC190_06555 [Leptospira mayottensis 200901116]TGM89618.1 hypothetical protein EHR03_18905 [Leptospira mayottensis]
METLPLCFPVKIGIRFQGNVVSRKNFQENQRIVNNFLFINLQMRKISVIQSESRTFRVALKSNFFVNILESFSMKCKCSKEM